jgi:Asp-tRNA(Asn)/Glu-tRNA(Gln) amidotransferase A subunit family amidase
MLSEPITRNSQLGLFTHFGNVLDLCGISVPAGTYPIKDLKAESNDGGRLPFAITLLGGSRTDAEVLEVGRRFEEEVKSRC